MIRETAAFRIKERTVVLSLSMVTVSRFVAQIMSPRRARVCGLFWLALNANALNIGATALAATPNNQGCVVDRYYSPAASLTDAEWVALRQHIGDVVLPNVTVISEDHARTLATIRGGLHLGIRDLSAATARALGKHRGKLGLPSLTTLSDEAAEALGTHTGDLLLNGVHEISDRGVVALTKSGRGTLALGIRFLNEQSARTLVRGATELELLNLDSLSDSAAEQLSTHLGRLRVPLLTITPGAAAALASMRGTLHITDSPFSRCKHSFIHVSDEAAGHLSRYQGDLVLPRTTPRKSRGGIFSALAMHSGSMCISIDEPLTVEEATALARHVGELGLCLVDGDILLSPESAKELSRHEGDLIFHGSMAISPSVAAALSGHRQGKLRIDRVADLSEAAATALAHHPGALTVLHVDNRASDTAVGALAKHTGRLTIDGDLVRDSTIDVLLKHEGGLFVDFGYHHRPGEEIMKRLAEYSGPLGFYGLGLVNERIAEKLAAHRGSLALVEVPQDEPTVHELLKHDGPLYFPEFAQVETEAAARLFASDRTLSTEVNMKSLLFPGAERIAEILAQKSGPLSLPKLRYISADALRALTAKKTVLLPRLDSLYIIDSEGRDVLAQDIVTPEIQDYNLRTSTP
jgi:hypothetical protein